MPYKYNESAQKIHHYFRILYTRKVIRVYTDKNRKIKLYYCPKQITHAPLK